MINHQAKGLLIGLALQYLLGMAINLYVQFPQGASAGQLWEFGWHQPLVAAHIIIAILLFTGSIAMLVRAYLAKSEAWKLPAWVGFAGILLAGFSGSRFIPTQDDPYSYAMAGCFLLAFTAYFWGLYRAKLA